MCKAMVLMKDTGLPKGASQGCWVYHCAILQVALPHGRTPPRSGYIGSWVEPRWPSWHGGIGYHTLPLLLGVGLKASALAPHLAPQHGDLGMPGEVSGTLAMLQFGSSGFTRASVMPNDVNSVKSQLPCSVGKGQQQPSTFNVDQLYAGCFIV